MNLSPSYACFFALSDTHILGILHQNSAELSHIREIPHLQMNSSLKRVTFVQTYVTCQTSNRVYTVSINEKRGCDSGLIACHRPRFFVPVLACWLQTCQHRLSTRTIGAHHEHHPTHLIADTQPQVTRFTTAPAKTHAHGVSVFLAANAVPSSSSQPCKFLFTYLFPKTRCIRLNIPCPSLSQAKPSRTTA